MITKGIAMRKSLSLISVVALMSSMVLTGCNEASIDMDRVQHIADNFNKISENLSKIDTEEMVESAENTAEIANELSEWVEENANEEVVEELPTQEEVEEFIEEEINDEDVTIFDIIDEQAAFELLVEPVTTQVDVYTKKSEEILEAANEKKEEGLSKIQQGLAILNDVYNKQEISESALNDVIEGTTLVVSGSNEISQGATELIQETAKSANELLAQAKILGIESKELDELKENLLKAQEIEIVAFSDETVKQLEEAKKLVKEYTDKAIKEADNVKVDVEVKIDPEQVKDYVTGELNALPDYAQQAKGILSSANNAAKYSQDLYKQIDAGSREVVKQAKEIVKGSSVMEDALKSYEEVGEYLDAIPTKELTLIEEKLDEVIKYTKSKDYKSLITKVLMK